MKVQQLSIPASVVRKIFTEGTVLGEDGNITHVVKNAFPRRSFLIDVSAEKREHEGEIFRMHFVCITPDDDEIVDRDWLARKILELAEQGISISYGEIVIEPTPHKVDSPVVVGKGSKTKKKPSKNQVDGRRKPQTRNKPNSRNSRVVVKRRGVSN